MKISKKVHNWNTPYTRYEYDDVANTLTILTIGTEPLKVLLGSGGSGGQPTLIHTPGMEDLLRITGSGTYNVQIDSSIIAGKIFDLQDNKQNKLIQSDSSNIALTNNSLNVRIDNVTLIQNADGTISAVGAIASQWSAPALQGITYEAPYLLIKTFGNTVDTHTLISNINNAQKTYGTYNQETNQTWYTMDTTQKVYTQNQQWYTPIGSNYSDLFIPFTLPTTLTKQK